MGFTKLKVGKEKMKFSNESLVMEKRLKFDLNSLMCIHGFLTD